MVPVDRLKSFKLFKETAAAGLDRLAHNMNEKTYGPGDVILKEGEVSGSLYLIASGVVSVEKRINKEEGKDKVVARLEAEEFFGEMAFLENQPHSATVVAQTPVRLFVLPRRALDELIDKDAKLALDQVLTLLSGVSSRLRRTTKELVTVFEVARAVGRSLTLDQLTQSVFDQFMSGFDQKVSLAFYRWNPFNDEYALMGARGDRKSAFPGVIEQNAPLLSWPRGNIESRPSLAESRENTAPLPFSSGHLILSRIDMLDAREGLFVFHSEAPHSFDAGERQLIETVSAVLAPSLATARSREEGESRARLERSRQERYYI